MKTCFLHSGDWQLGMTRHFLTGEAQHRFAQDRLDAIRTLGRVARRGGAEFVVVAGDVFESNHVSPRTVGRALEAMKEIPVPVFLLPGNHDPLDAASIYRAKTFAAAKPEHVHVIVNSTPVEVKPGVEVLGAPWRSKRPLTDLVAGVLDELEPRPGTLRVLVAHGAVDTLSPNPLDPAQVGVAAAEAALADGRIHYLALGDRHSKTSVGGTGRIWYAGAPEPTDFREEAPGEALLVTLTDDAIEVDAEHVARWRFEKWDVPLDGDEDLAGLATRLDDAPEKARTILKLSFTGTLTLSQAARLNDTLERAKEVFAAVETWERRTELAVVPDAADFAEVEVSGFAERAMEELVAKAASTSEEESDVAKDALALLVRLARRGE